MQPKLKTPSSTAPSPESSPSLLASPAVPFDLAVAMADTAEERDGFHDLAVAHGFFNPRQLIRLRNSYRLLKLLEAQVARGVSADQRISQEQMMRMIFWQDFLQGFAREERERLTRWLLHEEPLKEILPQAQEVIDRVTEPLRKSLGEDSAARETAHERSARFASLLVLPRGD